MKYFYHDTENDLESTRNFCDVSPSITIFLSQILVLHPNGDGDQHAEDQKIAQYPEDGGIQNLEFKGAGIRGDQVGVHGDQGGQHDIGAHQQHNGRILLGILLLA